MKDPKIAATTSYTYDGLGNLLTQVSPDTGTTTFSYDNAGNVATQTDARGTVTTYTYDALNRVTAATVTDGTVTYEYDNLTTGGPYAKGRLTRVTDPSGNTTYAYDALGRITAKVQTTSATPANKTFTVGYGFAAGRQTGITYPSGRAVTYGFNAQGQVTSIAVDGTAILSGVLYEPFGGSSAGAGDAFRHCYWSCCMTNAIGAEAARSFGDGHEEWRGNPMCEKNMDLFNNAMGITLARGNPGQDCKLLCRPAPLQKKPSGSCAPCDTYSY